MVQQVIAVGDAVEHAFHLLAFRFFIVIRLDVFLSVFVSHVVVCIFSNVCKSTQKKRDMEEAFWGCPDEERGNMLYLLGTKSHEESEVSLFSIRCGIS